MQFFSSGFARRDFLKGAGAAIVAGRSLWASPIPPAVAAAGDAAFQPWPTIPARSSSAANGNC